MVLLYKHNCSLTTPQQYDITPHHVSYSIEAATCY